MTDHNTYSLQQWLEHFTHLHNVGIDMGLSRISAVWESLRKTHNIERIASKGIITVAGTNGKGSACTMLTMLLAAQGHSVGTYTSPHIHRFSEQVCISGPENYQYPYHNYVSDALLTQAFAAIEAARGMTTISYFEAATLAGLLVFAWQSVDYAVLEVGLGGRLDAVNIIDADAALITSISVDHEAFLGSNPALIAIEKAGIYRTHKPAIYADNTLYQELTQYCSHNNIELTAKGRDFFLHDDDIIIDDKHLSVPKGIRRYGAHQASNFAGVAVVLQNLGLLPHHYTDILEHFHLPGRCQTIQQQPRVIIDVAHNDDAAKKLASTIATLKDNHTAIHAVIGMLSDKDHKCVLQHFDGLFDSACCCTTAGDRGMTGSALATKAKHQLKCPITINNSVSEGLQSTLTHANNDDLIIAFGSFLVAEALLPKA